MQLIVTGQIDGLTAHYREIIIHPDGVDFLQHPFAVDPGPDFFELAEIDFRVEICGEIFAVAAGVHIQNVDGVDGIEIILFGEGAPGVHHARIKADAQNGGLVVGFETFFAFPLVIGVPRWIFTDFVRFFVNGGVHVYGAGFQAGFHDCHIDKGLAYVDHDFGFGVPDQVHQGRNVQCIDLPRIELARRILQVFLPHYAFNDSLTFFSRSRGDADVPQNIVIHRTFVSHHVRHSTSADNQYIFTHFFPPLSIVLFSGQIVQKIVVAEFPQDFQIPV